MCSCHILAQRIVTRIAELHGARLSVGNHPAGDFVDRIDGWKARLLSLP